MRAFCFFIAFFTNLGSFVAQAGLHPDLVHEESQSKIDRLEELVQANLWQFRGSLNPRLHWELHDWTIPAMSDRKCQLLLFQVLDSHPEINTTLYVNLSSSDLMITTPPTGEELTHFKLEMGNLSSKSVGTLLFRTATQRDQTYSTLLEIQQICKDLAKTESKYLAKDQFSHGLGFQLPPFKLSDSDPTQLFYSRELVMLRASRRLLPDESPRSDHTDTVQFKPTIDYFPQTHAVTSFFTVELPLWIKSLHHPLSPEELAIFSHLNKEFHEKNVKSQIEIYKAIEEILRENPEYVVFEELPDFVSVEHWLRDPSFVITQQIFQSFNPDSPSFFQQMELRKHGAARILYAQGKLKYLLPAELGEDAPPKLYDLNPFWFEMIVGRNRSILIVNRVQELVLKHKISRSGIVVGAAHDLVQFSDPAKVNFHEALPRLRVPSADIPKEQIHQGFLVIQKKLLCRSLNEFLESMYRNPSILTTHETLSNPESMNLIQRAVSHVKSVEDFIKSVIETDPMKAFNCRWSQKKRLLVPIDST